MLKKINLALQGGGAHGAFTWGVLDLLLQQKDIDISMISSTSSGALNAVAVADGLLTDGREGARQRLEDIWSAISEAGRLSPIRRTFADRLSGNWSLTNSPGFHMVDFVTRFYSPYQFNPLDFNPVKEILEEHINFQRLRDRDDVRIFVSATSVETGRVKVFDHEHLSADVVLAAGCLPLVNQSVKIDGMPYWDGGFTGNPPLFPFGHHSDTDDVVIVQLTPLTRKGTPKSRQEITDRIYEISFNNSMLYELERLDLFSRLNHSEHPHAEDHRDIRLHMIEDLDLIRSLGVSSTLNMEWAFLTHMRDQGRAAARAFLDKNYEELGASSTFDYKALLGKHYEENLMFA